MKEDDNTTDNANLPKHVGIILDGNRRWARDRNLDPTDGHRAGVDALKVVAKHAFSKGVKYLSTFAFSTENWKRSDAEVNFLMGLVTNLVETELKELEEEGIKVVILGSRERLSKKVIEALDRVEARTKNNPNGTLALCFNYGGQQEIADAVKSMLSKNVTPSELTPELISANLYKPDIPPVDLLIRTAGERRISNFMLWRAAYSELLFVDKYWPDYNETDFDAALVEFAGRQRRFGGD